VREAFGSGLDLQVDANQAYRPGDEVRLAELDEFGLLLIEQPFGRRELLAHARLAQRLRTPVCLDESIASLADAAVAIAIGACGVINIKPARVGGYLEARAIHDLCQAQGIPVFCGGVLESGVGRAANLALAALPNFTLRGDISATSRYFRRDITQPFELHQGMLEIPAGPGSGAEIDFDALRAMTVHSQEISL
jgi:O-succinylbenzoate synthase